MMIAPDSWIPLVTAISGATVTIIGAIGMVLMKLKSVETNLRILTTDVNSKMDRMLALNQLESYARGAADERQNATGNPKPLPDSKAPPTVDGKRPKKP